jgi:Tfp pilus assembly major pilin PilA
MPFADYPVGRRFMAGVGSFSLHESGWKTMDKHRTRLLTLSELAVMLGVAGILASIAIPSYVRMKNHSRFEELVDSVKSYQEDMPVWLQTSVTKGGPGPEAGVEDKNLRTKVVAAEPSKITGHQLQGAQGPPQGPDRESGVLP